MRQLKLEYIAKMFVVMLAFFTAIMSLYVTLPGRRFYLSEGEVTRPYARTEGTDFGARSNLLDERGDGRNLDAKRFTQMTSQKMPQHEDEVSIDVHKTALGRSDGTSMTATLTEVSSIDHGDDISEELDNTELPKQSGNRVSKKKMRSIGSLHLLSMVDIEHLQGFETGQQIFTNDSTKLKDGQEDVITEENVMPNQMNMVNSKEPVAYIEKYNISGTHATNIRFDFDCDTVKVIDASNNNIKHIPDEIGQMRNLISVKFKHNKIVAIPKSIKGCKNLKYANFYGNNLIQIPLGLTYLQELRTLQLGKNNITMLRGRITQMPKLHKLYINYNNLNSLPTAIGQMDIRRLSAEGNHLSELPENFAELYQLVWLNLSENNLKKLPKNFYLLKQLNYLDLRKNLLVNLEGAFVFMDRLVYLNLSENLLTDVLEIISPHNSLKYLFLSGNKLTRVPQALPKLNQIETLSLSDNMLTEIPSDIENCQNLRRLLLSNNRLMYLPSTIGNLKNIVLVVLVDNPDFKETSGLNETLYGKKEIASRTHLDESIIKY